MRISTAVRSASGLLFLLAGCTSPNNAPRDLGRGGMSGAAGGTGMPAGGKTGTAGSGSGGASSGGVGGKSNIVDSSTSDTQIADASVDRPSVGGQTDGAADARDTAMDQKPCVPTTEQCFNGLDDDCDGKIDCADPDCSSGARCAAAPGASGRIGLVVPGSSPCPTGFGAPVDLHRGLATSILCGGCSCTNPVTSCSLGALLYGDRTSCGNNTGTNVIGTGGTVLRSSDGGVGICTPADPPQTFWRFTGTVTTTQTCDAFGTPAPVPPSWLDGLRFCPAPAVGAGCSGGVCLAKADPAAACVLMDANATCPAGYADDLGGVWYSGYQDSRTCGACSCGASFGDCSSVQLFRSDACTGGGVLFTLNGSDCGQEFDYRLHGQPTAPTCSANQPTTSGTVTATGGSKICCQPIVSGCDPDGGHCAQLDGSPCALDSDCASARCMTYFRDGDGDTYGTPTDWRRVCASQQAPPPAGFSLVSTDCCDSDANAHPGQQSFFTTADACQSYDYDCDGAATPLYPANLADCSTNCANNCNHGCNAPSGGPSGWSGAAPGCGQAQMWSTCTLTPVAAGVSDQSCSAGCPGTLAAICSVGSQATRTQSCH